MRSIFFFALPAVAFSCSTVYQPSSVITPLLDEKGDIELQVTGRMGDMTTDFAAWPISGATISTGLAYALTNHYAAMVNFEYQNEDYKYNPSFLSEHNARKGYLGEVYFGKYFFKPEISNTAILLGLGKGFRDLSFVEYNYSSSAMAYYKSDYLKASILFQHSLRDRWYEVKERLIVNLFLRTSFIHNYKESFHSTNNYYLTEYRGRNNFFTVEPGANISLKYGRFVYLVQGIVSVSPYAHRGFQYASMATVSLGARVNLNHKK